MACLSRNVLMITNVCNRGFGDQKARFDGFADVDNVLCAVVHGSKGDFGAHLPAALARGVLEDQLVDVNTRMNSGR